MMATGAGARPRLLVVEDEVLIGMLLEDMLSDLGYEVVGVAAQVAQAAKMAREAAFDAAILDVNVNGQPVYPVAAILRERGVPFLFASGYGARGLPPEFRNCPVLQKPFQQGSLETELAALLRADARGVAGSPGGLRT